MLKLRPSSILKLQANFQVEDFKMLKSTTSLPTKWIERKHRVEVKPSFVLCGALKQT